MSLIYYLSICSLRVSGSGVPMDHPLSHRYSCAREHKSVSIINVTILSSAHASSLIPSVNFLVYLSYRFVYVVEFHYVISHCSRAALLFLC